MNKQIEKQLTPAREHLDPDESPVQVVFGAYETKSLGTEVVKNGIFIATEKRVVFYGKRMFGFDLETYPYESISSIELSKGFMGYTISFFASGNNVKMKWVNTKNVKDFVEFIRGCLERKKVAANVVSSPAIADPIEQIKKLDELKQSGILTESEFSTKKAEILSRM